MTCARQGEVCSLAIGKLDSEAARSAAEHARECAECREALDWLSQVVRRQREAHPEPSTAAYHSLASQPGPGSPPRDPTSATLMPSSLHAALSGRRPSREPALPKPVDRHKSTLAVVLIFALFLIVLAWGLTRATADAMDPARQDFGPYGLLERPPEVLRFPVPVHAGKVFVLLQGPESSEYLWQAEVEVEQEEKGTYLEIEIPDRIRFQKGAVYVWEILTDKDEPGLRWAFHID